MCLCCILAWVYVCAPPLSALWTAGQLTPQWGWISISNYWHGSACLLTATSLPWGRLYRRHGYHPWDQMKKDESGAERHWELFRIALRAFKALPHQTHIKEPAAMKTECCLTSHCLCFSQKQHSKKLQRTQQQSNSMNFQDLHRRYLSRPKSEVGLRSLHIRRLQERR